MTAAPREGSPARVLPGLNPLAKILGPAPAIVALVFVRDLATPATLLALAALVLVVGAPWTGRLALLLFAVTPVVVSVVSAGLAVWADPARLPPSPPLLRIGDAVLTVAAAEAGLATGLRLGAILALALIGGLTTTGPDLVRSLVQQLRVPYRIGYAGLAAIRFVPRFAYEFDLIRRAHRVRGRGGRGPVAAVRRTTGSIVPLLAGGIRHAERVALAMDARAFGAHPTRTERHTVPFRARDAVFVAVFWAASVAVFVLV